ncbi:IS21 family transposase, partial [Bacillaceae bacterium S4-13-56]
ELIQTIVEAPRYHVGARPKHSLTKEMEEKFQELVLENKEKRRNGLRKQQKKPKEAYIKGSFLPGDICEFDWGEVKITINGKR